MEKALYFKTDSRNIGSSSGCRSSRLSLAMKRILDILLSFFGLIVFSPVCLITGYLIRRNDHGPAIFAQERIGLGGRPFTLYKFRTMIVDSEPGGQAQLCHGEADSRLTPIGAFLRNHHLDELPQLWNVLRGDMSFVGYRPERKVFIDQIMEANPDYELLYSLRPGLFSYATLYNGYTDTIDKMLRRLEMDLCYMRTRSLWVDIKIIYLTVYSIISGKKF